MIEKMERIKVVELEHPTDPRYLLIEQLPQKITIEEIGDGTYGKLLLIAHAPPDVIYRNIEPGVWEKP